VIGTGVAVQERLGTRHIDGVTDKTHIETALSALQDKGQFADLLLRAGIDVGAVE
jgi:hypothetical protein